MLTAEHRAALKADTGVESWHFEQHADEAVFIPAGCPHQARALVQRTYFLGSDFGLHLNLNRAVACVQGKHRAQAAWVPTWAWLQLCARAQSKAPAHWASVSALSSPECACVPAHASAERPAGQVHN